MKIILIFVHENLSLYNKVYIIGIIRTSGIYLVLDQSDGYIRKRLRTPGILGFG